MDNTNWSWNKKKRELLQQIKQYERHAAREIENNKVCSPDKVRDNSQRYLQICIQRYEEFTGEKYERT